MTTLPIISQLKSLVQVCTGDADGAKKTQEQFLEAWKEHPGQTIGDLVDGIPVVGHVKGFVHLATGDKEGFAHSEEAATRTLAVVGAAALTGATGGLAAPILAGVAAGVVADAAITGIESARHDKYDPQGMISVGTNVVRDIQAGDNVSGDIFDGVVIAAGDGLVGTGTVKAKPVGEMTKVFRVEGKSLIKVDGDFGAGDNARLFSFREEVQARNGLPKLGNPEELGPNPGPVEEIPPAPGRNRGAGGDAHAGIERGAPIGRFVDPDGNLFADNGDSLHLNFGEEDRAYGYFAQKLVDHREAVKQYQELKASRGEPTGVTNETHEIRIKSFEVFTRDLETVELDSIPEDAKRAGIEVNRAKEAHEKAVDEVRKAEAKLEAPNLVDRARALGELETARGRLVQANGELETARSEFRKELLKNPKTTSERVKLARAELAKAEAELASAEAEHASAGPVGERAERGARAKLDHAIIVRDRASERVVAILQGRDPSGYDGVLRVDINQAPRQYGLTPARYTPILRKAIEGSFRSESPQIRNLPTQLLKVIRDYPVAFGRVRRFPGRVAHGVTRPTVLGSTGRVADDDTQRTGFDSTLAAHDLHLSGLTNEAAFEDVAPAALLHCRHVKYPERDTKAQTVDWSEHYEYLVKLPDGNPPEWYPEELIAEDLKQDYYKKTIASAKPVSSVVGRDGDKLLVKRPDGTVDKVYERQIFWEEQEPGTHKLHEREVDAILYLFYRQEHDQGRRISLSTDASFPSSDLAHVPPCFDVGGEPVYLGTAAHNGGIHPCKIAPHLAPYVCRVPYGGVEVTPLGNYDLLPFVPEIMEFVPASMGRVPHRRNAVLGGYEKGGQKLYHAIAVVDGVRVPGKAGPQFNGGMFPFNKKEVWMGNVEILCWK